jgi:large subunit ribosomal protein L30
MARTFVWHRTRGPRHTAKSLPITDGSLRIRQVRSGIGHARTMRLTLESLGLRHHQAEVIMKDCAALRGQLKKVRHLVEVTPVEE